MICFLTSRTDDPETGELFVSNRFTDELQQSLPQFIRALFICSDPDGWEQTDYYAGLTKGYFENAGFVFSAWRILDGRSKRQAAEYVGASDLIILAGGHVPTQNRFFLEIGLRELMSDWDGVVVGISAGSMNSADVVYAQPEREGEAKDESYRRFLTGLGLTRTMLLPHYQEVKDDVLDGMRLFEDITMPDSIGRTFYAIPDGSYLLVRDGREELRGEAYEIREGRLRQISADGETVLLERLCGEMPVLCRILSVPAHDGDSVR